MIYGNCRSVISDVSSHPTVYSVVYRRRGETCDLLLLLQLQLPSSAIMEGDVSWNPKNNTDFDYQTRGKLRIERQECQVSKANSAVPFLLV